MNKKHLAVFLTVIVVVLVGAAAIFMYYSSNKQTPVANANSNVNQPVVTANDNANVVVTNANTSVTNLNTNSVVNTNSAVNTNTSITTATSLDPSGTIQWDGPKLTTSLKVFKKTTNNYDPEVGWEEGTNGAKYYSVGTYLSGTYKGGTIILVSWYPEGPYFYPVYTYFVKQGSKLYLLGKLTGVTETSEDGEFDTSKFTLDTKTTIASLTFPKTVSDAATKLIFSMPEYPPNALFDKAQLAKVFTHPTLGEAFVTSAAAGASTVRAPMTGNGLYFRAPDGTLRVYKMTIPFVTVEDVPSITWSGGTKNAVGYMSTDIGGCGFTNYLAVVPKSEVDVDTDLEAIGKNANGENIYGLRDANHTLLKKLYDEGYWTMPDTAKMSYAAFIASRPLVFWTDPYGRLVKFTNNQFQPLAECGKPVIYLYPQQTTDVTVTLKPAGGFTYTEPAYNQGWKVRATPTGNLTELLTGKQYPYLFWEGRGGMYQTPEQGFVVAQADVHTFLQDKLTALGLNTQERADFVEFWEPRMQSAPYYFVTFMGNEVMDQLAPLTVSPQPDTTIRILMDYTPLPQPKVVQGYTIRTPERKGFTVVEWGGVLRSE